MGKRILFTIFGLLIASGIVFYACEKEKLFRKAGTVKSHVSAAFYDQKLLNQFMQLPLVDQFTDVIKSYLLTVNNGILSFKNEKDFNEIYDTLIYFSNEWDLLLEKNPSQYADYIKSDSFPDFPMLFAFEVITDFYSLRAQIERDVFQMQAKGGIDEKTNPDNHYTVSDFFRTLLSPDCELIIGDWILLFGEYQHLIIRDLDFDKLAEVKALWKQYGETDGTVSAFERQLAIDIDAVNWKSDESGCPSCSTLEIEEYIPWTTSSPQTVSFWAIINEKPMEYKTWSTSSCDAQKINWNFGDGTTSTEDNPKHTYSNGGFYTVKVSVTRYDGSTCEAEKRIEVSNCGVNITDPVKDPSYQGCGVRYKFRATPFHSKNQNAISYTLSFPFSTIPDQTQSTNNFTQIFTCNQDYVYEIKITYADGCAHKTTKRINVTGTGDCILNKDHQRHKDISTCSGYKINHHFRVWSVGCLKRVYVKNVHYKKNSLGWWILKKASNMNVSFGGNVVYPIPNNKIEVLFNCTTTTPVYPNGKSNSNKSMLLYDYPMKKDFRVKKESVHSSWSVKSSGSCSWASNSNEIKLHDKPCDD
ncbi:MAG: PKD domain-containing protein [Bacteroidales bacterium]|jgi:PKD repeat protein|nr:PKD domain-containing protein [Bacteroidales bacterium]